MLTVFNDDNLLLLESFGTFRLLALLELPETLCSRPFLRLKPQPAISFQNIMIPRALWLLHLQLDRKRSRVNTKWPHEKGFVIQTIKMPKPSRAVRITVLPEVEPIEQSSTLALLLMAFLPAWMALEKTVVTSAVAAGTADSTLHGMPQICLFMALGRLQGEAGGAVQHRGRVGCRAAGSVSHHAVPLCACPSGAFPRQGVCIPRDVQNGWMGAGAPGSGPKCPCVWNRQDAGHC